MYGRVRPDTLEAIFNEMKLKSTDVFIDLGHGIGTPSLQAAYSRGCESRGIELNAERNVIARSLQDALETRVDRLKETDINHEDVS